MWPLAVLLGDHINAGFFIMKCNGHFAGMKKNGRNNEVAIRQGSTVILHSNLSTVTIKFIGYSTNNFTYQGFS